MKRLTLEEIKSMHERGEIRETKDVEGENLPDTFWEKAKVRSRRLEVK